MLTAKKIKHYHSHMEKSLSGRVGETNEEEAGGVI